MADKTSAEQAHEHAQALVAMRDAYGNMQRVLERIRTLETALNAAVKGLDNASRFMPKMFEYSGAKETVYDSHVEQTNQVRKVLFPNG